MLSSVRFSWDEFGFFADSPWGAMLLAELRGWKSVEVAGKSVRTGLLRLTTARVCLIYVRHSSSSAAMF